jgi:hypothetical protein
MHWAATYGNASVIKRLASAGASINTRDRLGHLPLYYAAWGGQTTATEQLLDLHSEIDVWIEQMPVESALMDERLGDYYAGKRDTEGARNCYEIARAHFTKALQKYQTQARKATRAEIGEFLLLSTVAGMQGALATAQAQSQQHQMSQIAALKYANKTGTGSAGYFSYMQNVRSSVPTQLPPGNAELPPKLRLNAKAYRDLANGVQKELARVAQKLGALN